MPNANAELHKVNQVISTFFFEKKKESNELSPSSSSSNLSFFWPAIAMHQGLWKFSRYFPLIFKLNLKVVLYVLSLFFKLSNFPFTFVMLLCKKRWVKEAHKRGPFRNSYQFSPLFPAYLWWLSRHSLLWSLFQKKCIKSKIKTWKGRYKLHPECLKSPKKLRGTLSLVRLPPLLEFPCTL